MAQEHRGFAGFDSLVTDLSDLPRAAPNEPQAAPTLGGQRRQGADIFGDEPALPPAEPAKKKWFSKWVVVAIVGILVIGGVLVANENKPTSYSPSYQTAPTKPRTAYTPPPATSPSPAAQQLEEKPPLGDNTLLSTGQLRYCLSQDIRIAGADKVVNTTSQIDIDRLNTLVDDYNARCPKSRYYKSAMATVKPEVEARRAQLEREGAALIRSPYAR